MLGRGWWYVNMQLLGHCVAGLQGSQPASWLGAGSRRRNCSLRSLSFHSARTLALANGTVHYVHFRCTLQGCSHRLTPMITTCYRSTHCSLHSLLLAASPLVLASLRSRPRLLIKREKRATVLWKIARRGTILMWSTLSESASWLVRVCYITLKGGSSVCKSQYSCRPEFF